MLIHVLLNERHSLVCILDEYCKDLNQYTSLALAIALNILCPHSSLRSPTSDNVSAISLSGKIPQITTKTKKCGNGTPTELTGQARGEGVTTAKKCNYTRC